MAVWQALWRRAQKEQRREEADEYIDIKVVTVMSHARSADALIAVGGELGTLSESKKSILC